MIDHSLITQCDIITKPDAKISDTPIIIGIDEVGRGALFANLTVAAVILPATFSGEFNSVDLRTTPIELINDSKKLTATRRERLFEPIKLLAADYAIIDVPRGVIDEINVLHATLLGMRLAIETLVARHHLVPRDTQIVVDGHQFPNLQGGCAEFFYQNQTLIKGDATHSSIACASILAKVHRDRQMLLLDKVYPEYGLAKHKGYLTAQHKAAITTHGILPEHRRSYSPIKELFATGYLNHNFW